jgi:hypothetical protein
MKLTVGHSVMIKNNKQLDALIQFAATVVCTWCTDELLWKNKCIPLCPLRTKAFDKRCTQSTSAIFVFVSVMDP